MPTLYRFDTDPIPTLCSHIRTDTDLMPTDTGPIRILCDSISTLYRPYTDLGPGPHPDQAQAQAPGQTRPRYMHTRNHKAKANGNAANAPKRMPVDSSARRASTVCVHGPTCP